MKFILGMMVFVYGTFVTAVVLSLSGRMPESFLSVLLPWLVIGFFLMGAPKKLSGAMLLLCHVAMMGSLMVGIYFVGENVVAYFQKEPETACNYDCFDQIPDTSDDIDFTTPTGDNNHSPGTHSVEGHYRNGSYVEPYIRSNPDGILTNNIND